MKRKIFFLFLLICLTVTPFSSFADVGVTENIINKPVDLNEKCSINLKFAHRGIAFENEAVELYRVATISPLYVFSFTEEFVGTGITLNGAKTKGEWNTIRSTIENFIVSEKILPLDVAFTDENGEIIFENLEPGMYFTSSVRTARNGVGYAFDSVLSSLPNLKDGEPIYDVEVSTKPFRGDVPSEKVRYRVSKLWKDEGCQESRPRSIEVCIFKNKELQEKVVLNDANNWFYSWEAEDDGSVWNVSEINLTDDYVVLIEKRDTSFIIINNRDGSHFDDPSNPEIPLETDKPIQSTSRPSTDASPTGDTTNLKTYIVVIFLTGAVLIIVSILGNKALKQDTAD